MAFIHFCVLLLAAGIRLLSFLRANYRALSSPRSPFCIYRSSYLFSYTMNSEIVAVPQNSPVSQVSTLPPYESAPGSPNVPDLQMVNQAAVCSVLTQLVNDPRLSQMNFDVRGLGRTTLDIQCLPLSVVQALVLLGLTMNREVEQNDEYVPYSIFRSTYITDFVSILF